MSDHQRSAGTTPGSGGRKNLGTIAIAAKQRSRDAAAVAVELVEWLRRRGLSVQADRSLIRARKLKGVEAFEPSRDGKSRVDLIIVLGGDGTLLSVARSAAPGTPILGVNLGRLGFMTEVNRGELYPALIDVLDGKYETEQRSLMSVQLDRSSGSSVTYRALNDVVVTKSALARIIQLRTQINGLHVADYRADGLIVSTPTGSTAYNLSAGGPIVYPSLPVVILTPICPHTLTMRPLVVPRDSTIDVSLETDQEEVFLTLDGQEGTTLSYRDRVRVTADDQPVNLVKVSGRTFFDALRGKLRWGE